MAISVSLQGNDHAEGNPYIADVGTANSNAVIISSGAHGAVVYQIVRKDHTAFDGINGNTVLNIPWNFGTSELIKACDATSLTIVLPFRTEFQVRVSEDGGNTFGNGSGNNYSNLRWVDFKTRDKSYAIPDSTTELRVEQEDTAAGATVTVTNYGKASEVITAAGSTVTNTDYGSNEVSAIRATARGATVTARVIERVTARGVTIGG